MRTLTQDPTPQLRRSLGLGRAVTLGLSGTIGGSIFVLIGPATGLAGPGVLLAFVVAFVAILLFALPYAELACNFPCAGGGYAAARATLGEQWGFLVGWGYWGAWAAVGGTVTLGFGWYLHALTGLPSIPSALALVAVVTALNLGSPRLVSRAQTVVLLLGLGALLVFGLLGLPHAHAHPTRFVPFLPHGLGGVAAAAPIALLALSGFDSIAAEGEEILRPERTLVRAILLTLVIALGVYLLATVVAVGTVPYVTLGASSTPLTAAATTFLGPAGARLIALAALLTTASTANAALGTGSRILFGMARDGLLPRELDDMRAATDTPWIAVLVSAAAIVAVAASGSIAVAAAVGGCLYVLHYAFPVAGLLRLRLTGAPSGCFRTPVPQVILPLAGIACLALLGATGRVGLIGGLAWLLIGLAAQLVHRFALRPKRAASAQPADGRQAA
jgi:APA family basic amino acid/polyamine antiporter